MYKNIKKELDKNQYLLDLIKNENIKARISYNLNWFTSEAIKAKYRYYHFSMITIIAPVISSLVLMQDTNTNVKIVAAIFSGLSTIAAAILALFGFNKSWILYRNQAEDIKRILASSLAEKIDEKELLLLIENKISQTDKNWNKIKEESDV